VWRWDQQEPFGVNVPDENPSGLGAFDLPLRLPGQYFDKETNLHYNYFRDYDPSTGRYEESDLIGLKGGLNTYVYAPNPLQYTDPYGLSGSQSPAFYWKLLPTYGNWGQGYWSGGQWNKNIPANGQPPIDPLDACFKDHDFCFQSIQSGCLTPAVAATATSDCNKQLIACFNKLGPDPKYYCAVSPWKCTLVIRAATVIFSP